VSGKRLDLTARPSARSARHAYTPRALESANCQRKRLVGLPAARAADLLTAIRVELSRPEIHMGGAAGSNGTAGRGQSNSPDYPQQGPRQRHPVLTPRRCAMGQNRQRRPHIPTIISALPAFTTIDLYPDMCTNGALFPVNPRNPGRPAAPQPPPGHGSPNTSFWDRPTSRDVAAWIRDAAVAVLDNHCVEPFAGFERGSYAGLDATVQNARKEAALRSVRGSNTLRALPRSPGLERDP